MNWQRKVGFSLAAVLLVMGGAETLLRLTGFSYQPIPDRIWLGRYKGGIPTGEVIFDRLVPGLFTRDSRLFWRPVAGRPPFNRAGLRDRRELPARKPAGEFRILALGDSCTFLGEPQPWTERLEAQVKAGPHRVVRVLNAAVPAWSSLQGLRFLESRGRRLEPDLVTVYFGWNDHWRATVKPDAEFPLPPERVVAVQRVLAGMRIYQALDWILKGPIWTPRHGSPAVGTRGRRRSSGGPPFDAGEDLAATASRRPFRVPLVDFEANLRRLVDLARLYGARVLLITAPSTLKAGAVPGYLFVHGFVARRGEGIDSIHARYADAVRQVARETGALLVDAAVDFRQQSAGGEALVRADGIHLTAAGMDRLAALVARTVERAGLAGGGSPGPAGPGR